ncbi:LysE family translocator [Devosia sp. 2618]|uniref:LysE family translocator n=1 Tax=Devosia sp. 2618 TaxID=3156454 RepID=UPI00339A5477
MIDTAVLLPYLLACLLFTVVPGPSVSVVIANSLAGGTRAGLLTIFGAQLSMLSMVLVVAVGLEAVMGLVAGAFDIIKLIGAAYLVWIGFKMVRSSGHLDIGNGERTSAGRYIWQGALVSWGNPKSLLFLGAFLPQFINPAQPAFPQIVILGLIVMAVACITDGLYAICIGRIRHLLSTARIRMVNRVSGFVLMAGGIWLALQKRA